MPRQSSSAKLSPCLTGVCVLCAGIFSYIFLYLQAMEGSVWHGSVGGEGGWGQVCLTYTLKSKGLCACGLGSKVGHNCRELAPLSALEKVIKCHGENEREEGRL